MLLPWLLEDLLHLLDRRFVDAIDGHRQQNCWGTELIPLGKVAEIAGDCIEPRQLQTITIMFCVYVDFFFAKFPKAIFAENTIENNQKTIEHIVGMFP